MCCTRHDMVHERWGEEVDVEEEDSPLMEKEAEQGRACSAECGRDGRKKDRNQRNGKEWNGTIFDTCSILDFYLKKYLIKCLHLIVL